MIISSIHNPTVKAIVKLRDARERRRLGQFVIDGNAEIARALVAGVDILKLFVAEEAALPTELQPCADRVQVVSPGVLEKLSYGGRGAAPVAVARTPALPLEQLRLTPHSLVLVLDRIEKPGNLGACLRTAAASGADAVILTNPVCEVFNPNTIRSSRGGVFAMPIAVTTTEEFMEVARQLRLSIWAARVDGSQALWNCNFTEGAAVIFGSEAHGLGEDWRQAGVKSFQIPMAPQMDSLNVSISTAVTLYEAIRQRRPSAQR